MDNLLLFTINRYLILCLIPRLACCVPPGNTRKCSTIPLNPAGNTQQYPEMLGNTRKNSEILGNPRKYSDRNKGCCLCALLHPCVPLCIPVYPPEILGNARQYPSIRREILSNTWKGSEILGNTPQQTKRAKSRVPNIWLESVVLLYGYTLFLRLK